MQRTTSLFSLLLIYSYSNAMVNPDEDEKKKRELVIKNISPLSDCVIESKGMNISESLTKHLLQSPLENYELWLKRLPVPIKKKKEDKKILSLNTLNPQWQTTLAAILCQKVPYMYKISFPGVPNKKIFTLQKGWVILNCPLIFEKLSESSFHAFILQRVVFIYENNNFAGESKNTTQTLKPQNNLQKPTLFSLGKQRVKSLPSGFQDILSKQALDLLGKIPNENKPHIPDRTQKAPSEKTLASLLAPSRKAKKTSIQGSRLGKALFVETNFSYSPSIIIEQISNLEKTSSTSKPQTENHLLLSGYGLLSIGGLYNLKVTITSLDVSKNRLQSIHFLSYLGNLRKVNVDENQIQDITPVKKLINLEELSASGNKIREITPLENATDLKVLNLSRNQIHNIDALQKLVKLQEVILSHNMSIKDLSPLKEAKDLKKAELINLPRELSDPLCKDLPNCTFYHDWDVVQELLAKMNSSKK